MSATGALQVRLWDEWRRITRFLESGRVAFARERDLWAGLELVNPDAIKLNVPPEGRPSGRGYRIGLPSHQEALADEELFHAAVLLHTYALTEAVSHEVLVLRGVTFGTGIESWGLALLQSHPGPDGPRGWSAQVSEADLVETTVHRNVFAHGGRRLDERAVARLHRVARTSWNVGDHVPLAYDALRVHRARLRQLLRDGGLGEDR